MIKQALATNENVSCSLSMAIFDKQILPILTYGCVIWGLPPSNNCLNLSHLPDNLTDIGAYCRDYVKVICKKEVQLDLVKNTTRPHTHQSAVIKFRNFRDKELFMASHSKQTCSVILGETSYGPNSSYEKVHTDFCKYTLNMSKYASTDACLGELGRYPIINTISLYCMKYWLRLEQGTKNKLLNEAWQKTNVTVGWKY